MKRRLRAGFTLAETLITVALLSIVFLAISGGFVVFTRAYKNVTRKANAQVMLSTAIMQVTNDLKNATVYYTAGNAFETSSRGYAIQYNNNITDDPKGIQVVAYSTTTTPSGLATIDLLTSKTNTDNMYTMLTWDSTVPCVISKTDQTALFTLKIDVRSSDDSGKIIESQTITVRSNGSVTVK